MELTKRPRRLRNNDTVRRLVRETRISPDALIYPLFVQEGKNKVEEIPALPGQYRYTPDRMEEALVSLADAGIRNVMLFGIPLEKDAFGSGAWAEDGVVQQALQTARRAVPELLLITDVCLCEYTSHGHCGVVCGMEIDNDQTLTLLAKTALSHVQAGASMVAPSDMMDGRIRAIRNELDQHAYTNIPIMSYAVKYASAFYGPFRQAAGSAPVFGDRKSYQMDWHNSREALREALLDEEEGADILMVKPAASYLDLVAKVRQATTLPLATYSVSGEYAMVKAAAEKGWIDEASMVCEMAASAFRAGADIYITYFAKEIAAYWKEGRIG